jgi:hypothetical protein
METSLARLQKQVDSLKQHIVRLQDCLAHQKEEKNRIRTDFNKYKKQTEARIEKAVQNAVNKAVTKITTEYEKIIKEKDQRIFELENRLNINSDNSSLPSSKTPIYQSKICNSRKKTEEKPGRKLGHKKDKLKRFEDDEITEIKEHKTEKCLNCNSTNLKIIGVKERDEYDIEVKVKKIRHKFYEYECLDCGKKIKSTIPLELHGENQYGAGIKTLALTLSNYGFVAYNRIRKIIYGLTDGEADPSEGYLNKLQKKASDKLKNFIFDTKEEILKSKLNYWDDTVISIGEKDHACLRVYTNGDYVLYKAHLAKNIEGMDKDGILQNLPSECTVMHDHLLHNYCDKYSYKNIECNAHITRKLEGITQNAKHNWSDNMKKLLESTLEKRKINIENHVTCFTDEEIKDFDNKYDAIIEAGFKEYIEFKHKYEFEREENLLEFMRDYKSPITEWVRDYSLPFSNNLCESLLRMLKSKMKISYQFKSLSYAEYFANIMTYTETCGRFGENKVVALKRLFENNPYTIEELNTIKEKTTSYQ